MNADDASLEKLARRLEKSRAYKVLRRFTPPRTYSTGNASGTQ